MALAVHAFLTLPLLLTGCFAVNKVERDIDRTPTVNTGAGATVIMPGQTAPVYQSPLEGATPDGGGGGGVTGTDSPTGTASFSGPPAATTGS